jgi:hypothetical protein
MMSIRLPIDMEQRLTDVSKIRNMSKSELIKEALSKMFSLEENELDSYEIGKDYFGKYGSSYGNLSTSYKKALKEKLNDKFRSR